MGAHSRDDIADTHEFRTYSAPSPMDVLKTLPVNKPDDVKLFIANTVDRVARTLVQALVGYTTASAFNHGAFSVLGLLSVVLGAGIISLGTCMISAPTFNHSWWFQLTERAVKTFIQTFISGMTVATIGGINFSLVPSGYTSVLAGSAVAALASLGTSVVSTNVGTSQTAVDVVVPEDTVKTRQSV